MSQSYALGSFLGDVTLLNANFTTVAEDDTFVSFKDSLKKLYQGSAADVTDMTVVFPNGTQSGTSDFISPLRDGIDIMFFGRNVSTGGPVRISLQYGDKDGNAYFMSGQNIDIANNAHFSFKVQCAAPRVRWHVDRLAVTGGVGVEIFAVQRQAINSIL